MAITFIKPMRTAQHVANAIRYATNDKTDIENELIVHKTLTTYINTSPHKTANEWEIVRKSFGKDNGKLAFQIIQNFGEDIDPVLANKIGTEFARELLGCRQALVSTHTNTPYIHNHIIFNSVELEHGRKYYDNIETYYGRVRKISDKLCEKYGLKVLENTKDGVLKFYRDKNGKTKYFEPTERKSRNFNNEYAKMETWRKSEQAKKNKRIDVINDMDIIIPISKSYEDFVQKMKNIGYQVLDKTKTGEWRKHISFTPPNSTKAVRDTSLNGGVGYTRLDIEKKIKKILEQNKNAENSFDDVDFEYIEQDNDDIVEQYDYWNVNEIDSETRSNGVSRGDLERLVINRVKELNQVVDDKYAALFEKNKNYLPRDYKERKTQIIINQINSNLRTLNFLERYNVDTFNHLQSQMERVKEKRDIVLNELNEVREKLKSANENVASINEFRDLAKHISKQKEMYGYAYEELEQSNEINYYEALKDKLYSMGLETIESQDDYINAISNFQLEYEEQIKEAEQVSDRLKEIDDVFKNLQDIDSKNSNYYIEDIKQYEFIRYGKLSEEHIVNDKDYELE